MLKKIVLTTLCFCSYLFVIAMDEGRESRKRKVNEELVAATENKKHHLDQVQIKATHIDKNNFDPGAMHDFFTKDSFRDLSRALTTLILDNQKIRDTITQNVTLPEINNIQSSYDSLHSGALAHISPDGQYIMRGQWKTPLIIQNLANDQIVFDKKMDDISTASWSPDSRYIATKRPGLIQVWDIARQECIASLKHDDKEYLYGFCRPIWSPDQTHITIWLSEEKTVIWNIAQNTYSSISSTVTSAWRADGQEIAANSLDGINLLDIHTGKCIKTIPHHNNQSCLAMNWSPTKKLLAMITHENNTKNGTLRVYDLTLSKDIVLVKIDSRSFRIRLAGWSNNDRVLVIYYTTTIQLWDMTTGTCIKSIPFTCNCPADIHDISHIFYSVSLNNDG